VSSASAALLIKTARATGLSRGLVQALRPWRGDRSRYDPGAVVLDLAVAIALGGDCLADLAVPPRGSGSGGAAARWLPAAGGPRSGRDDRAGTFGRERRDAEFTRTFGFHPVLDLLDHVCDGTGEPLAALLREGRANANDAADQIAVLDTASAQLPAQARGRVLVREDTCGSPATPTCTH
jgi:hypothetical protein